MSALDELVRIVGQGHSPATSSRVHYEGPIPRIDVDDFGEIRAPLRPVG